MTKTLRVASSLQLDLRRAMTKTLRVASSLQLDLRRAMTKTLRVASSLQLDLRHATMMILTKAVLVVQHGLRLIMRKTLRQVALIRDKGM